MDREIPRLQARLDELTKLADAGNPTASSSTPAPAAALGDRSSALALTPDQQKEFVAVTGQLKLLTDRRALLLARTGDDFATDPPKLPSKSHP